jgi:hypothetical protein
MSSDAQREDSEASLAVRSARSDFRLVRRVTNFKRMSTLHRPTPVTIHCYYDEKTDGDENCE